MDAGESDANMICCLREVTGIQALAQFSHRESRLMMQQFPIFVDLHVVPPLIIGDPPSFPAYAGQPAVAARLTSPAAGSSAAIAMARFFCKFFHEFFGSSLDKLSAKSQLACMVFWHSQAMSARRC